MKDILIIIEPQRLPDYESNYQAIKAEATKHNAEEILGTGFLLRGPNSFAAALALGFTCMKNSLPFAAFEIENVLSVASWKGST